MKPANHATIFFGHAMARCPHAYSTSSMRRARFKNCRRRVNSRTTTVATWSTRGNCGLPRTKPRGFTPSNLPSRSSLRHFAIDELEALIFNASSASPVFSPSFDNSMNAFFSKTATPARTQRTLLCLKYFSVRNCFRWRRATRMCVGRPTFSSLTIERQTTVC